MSRTIAVSTEVFAAIWAQRREGEETEVAILRRIVGSCPVLQASAVGTYSDTATGLVDKRNGVTFPRGLTIFRTYKRREYTAVADLWSLAQSGCRAGV